MLCYRDTCSEAVGDVIVIDMARGVTLDLGSGTYPFWSPDGKRCRLISMPAKSCAGILTPSAPPTALAELQGSVVSLGDISPDGKYVAVRDSRGLVAVPLGHGNNRPIVFGEGNNPRFSPDGRYIAYNGSFRSGIYVEKFPERTPRTVAANSGTSVVWGRDGKKLYYRSVQGRLVSVDVHESANGISFGSAHELFPLPDAAEKVRRRLRRLTDGKRFLNFHRRRGSPHAETELTVLLNWREALKK